MLQATAEMLQQARKDGYAVGAFNIYNMEGALAVVRTAERLQSPVMLQLLPRALEIGGSPLITFCRAAASNARVPVAVHLDHCPDEKVTIPLVLHGTSGLPDKMIRESISHGVAKFNVNTEVRSRYMEAMEEICRQPGTELVNLMEGCIEAMQEPIEHKILLFGSNGRIQ